MEEQKDILLLRDGDRDAFARLYRRYWAKVYHFAGLFLTDPMEQEDIVQQVFLHLWDVRSRLDPARGMDGLLFIVTRNAVFKRLRRKGRTETLNELLLDQEQDLQTSLEAKEMQGYIDSLVEALPERRREAFRLSREEGLSYKEIAARMGISEKGVERHIRLALQFLKENLPLFLFFCLF